MHTVVKKDLAHAIAEKTGCHAHLATKMADVLFETLRDALIAGNRIEIRGFGVFLVKPSKAKPAARNPRTGEVVYVPARMKTHFKAGKELAAAMHIARTEV